MQIILLLISVMALAYFSRPADKQSYQIAILAIIGFAYLFIWRFVDFYMTVFMFDDDIKDASFFVVMFITVAIGLLPVVRKITRTVSMVLAAIFVMSMLLTF